MSKAVEHQDAGNRVVLYNVEIEQALLGSMLVDNRTIAAARGTVKTEDFYDPLHQALAELLFEYDDEGKTATPLTVHAWAKHWPGYQELGGVGYLVSLAEAAPARPTIRAFCEVIVEHAWRRRAFETMRDAQDALQTRDSMMSALEPVVAIADEISAARMASAAQTSAGELAYTSLRAIEEQAKKGEEFGMRTGLEPLDRLIGGFYPENAIMLGGRPGMGKSILACNWALAAAKQGFAADYWSVEMPSREVTARMICDIDYDMAIREKLAPLHYEDLVKMRASGAQMQRAAEAARMLRELDISIFDRDRVTIGEIAAVERSRVARDPDRPRIILVDHLHILMPSERYSGRRVDELSEITGATKRLAKRIGAPVVMLAQLSRDIEKRDDKRPFMSDFRDSGSIEQDADVVMTVYRHEYYAARAIKAAKNEEQRVKAIADFDAHKGVLEIGVPKQRSGATEVTAECFVDAKSSVVRSGDPKTADIRQAAMDLVAGLNGQ